MPPIGEKRRRLSLTKSQIGEEAGAGLLTLLKGLVADGKVTKEETAALDLWLAKNQDSGLPAIEHLNEIVRRIVADGIVTAEERIELQLGIETVLPVSERRFAVNARERIKALRSGPRLTKEDLKLIADVTEEEESEDGTEAGLPLHWRDHPATERQRDFINSLGGSLGDDATKGAASELIDWLLSEKPPTSRQQMVLRFWGIKSSILNGPAEVSEWMNAFYSEDSDRKDAWELFKEESGDDGRQGNPERVPFGIGPDYLARIKRSGSSHPESVSPKRGFLWKAFTVVGAGCAAALWFLVLQERHPRTSEGTTSSPPPANQTSPPADATASKAKPDTSAAVSIVGRDAPQSSKPAAPPKTERRRINEALVSRATGIIMGKEPKILIDGALYAVGETVRQSRGLRPTSIDLDARSVRFEDDAGDYYARTLK